MKICYILYCLAPYTFIRRCIFISSGFFRQSQLFFFLRDSFFKCKFFFIGYFPFIFIWVDFLKSILFYLFGRFKIFFDKFFLYFWVKFIKFLGFSLYRKRFIHKYNFTIFIKFLLKLFLIYLFFYQTPTQVLLFFFEKSFLSSIFSYWDLNSFIFYNFFLLMDIDNLLLLFYIYSCELGFYDLFFSPISSLTTLSVGLYWIDIYHTYKIDFNNLPFWTLFFREVNFNCFPGNFSDLPIVFYWFSFSLESGLYWINVYYNFIDFCCELIPFHKHTVATDLFTTTSSNNNYEPIFFYFGMLFFSTVVLSWFFFSFLGLYGIYKLNVVTLFLFLLSLLFSAESILVKQNVYVIKLCSWVFLSLNVRIDYYFLVDTISFSFMLLTTTIAFFVFIYAFSYFKYEPLVDRFLLFLLSFVISMIFLVTSGNTVMLFLGWELIGFTSFCLINFWTTKVGTLKSAFKAFTFNKVSDFFMFMFLVSTYSMYYTFDILSLNNQTFKYESSIVYIFGTPINFLEFVSLMVIGAAFIKSAQIGGHAWLPDSMEAPVPASSLIHSATLVSAGIYLILRFNFIFDSTQYSKFLIPIVGSFTAAYGGVCALSQSDIKKTLAYSTISHCGFLMVLCATEMNEFTLLYLYVHGFFKAIVFMCVGNVLRITRGYQDTRRMGGLLKYLPFEYFCVVVGLLNLAGLPFTFGFFIKHLLLINLDTHMYIYYFVFFNCLVGAFSGLFYSYRLVTFTFNDFKKGGKVLYTGSNPIHYNSNLYSNTTNASVFAILFLLLTSYTVIYSMFGFFINGDSLFSDCMNTTILTNYYSVLDSSFGYLLNFSYINSVVVILVMTLLFSKFRKVQSNYNWINVLCFVVFFILFCSFFVNFI